MSTYAIEFRFPEGVLYAGKYKDTLGWAPTVATAMLFDDPDDARRLLENGYGPSAEHAYIVPVRAGH